jgi:hypothetical protein
MVKRSVMEATMCKVLNKHRHGIAAGAVYIGHGSKWGNSFRIGVDGDRACGRWVQPSSPTYSRPNNPHVPQME